MTPKSAAIDLGSLDHLMDEFVNLKSGQRINNRRTFPVSVDMSGRAARKYTGAMTSQPYSDLSSFKGFQRRFSIEHV
jgi:hypothetical protein